MRIDLRRGFFVPFTRGIFLLLIAVLASPLAQGAVARSASYSLEYATAAAGSGSAHSQGNVYSMVTLVNTEGAAVRSSVSSSYSLQPALAIPAAPTAAVGDWMLYEQQKPAH